MIWAMLENCEQMRNLVLGHLETSKNLGFINAETFSTWLLDPMIIIFQNSREKDCVDERGLICVWHRIDFEESRFRGRKCVRSANNVELDRDACAPLLAFSNSLSLSQIHFQLSGNHFHFFSKLLPLVRNSFSQTGHIFWVGGGAESSGNSTYVQFMPFEHLAWAQNFHQLITWSAVSTKNACFNIFNEMCAISRSGKQL